MENKSSKKFIILGILICLFIASTGYSFAYFVTGIIPTMQKNKVQDTSAKIIEVTYDAGSKKISLLNTYPGQKDEKNFSVTVKPTSDQKQADYTISIDILSNGFTCSAGVNTSGACNQQELVYTLTNSEGQVLSTGDITNKNTKIKLKDETKIVEKETTYTYTLKVEFKYLNLNQNNNRHQTFNANLLVELT